MTINTWVITYKPAGYLNRSSKHFIQSIPTINKDIKSKNSMCLLCTPYSVP